MALAAASSEGRMNLEGYSECALGCNQGGLLCLFLRFYWPFCLGRAP
jgi:hypothetical protein